MTTNKIEKKQITDDLNKKPKGNHMKKLLIGLALIAGATSQAQTSTATTSTSTSATSANALSPEAPAQTVTTSVQEVGGWRKKFDAKAYFAFFGDAAPLNNEETRKDAAITSENYLAIGYKLNDTTKLQVRHNFAWDVAGEKNGTYTLIDPAVFLQTKGPKLGGFEPMAAAIGYYIPVSEPSRNAKTAGVIRGDISADYIFSPKVTGTLFTSPRLTINTAANEANYQGSDSSLRFIGGVTGTYNFNDNFSTYYSPYVDYRTTDLNRGAVRPTAAAPLAPMEGEKYNLIAHEVGVSMQVMKQLSINPAVINYVSLNTGEGFGREEYLEYDLYVTATF